MNIEIINVSETYPETPYMIEGDGIPLALVYRRDVAETLVEALEKAKVEFGKGMLPAKTKPTPAVLAAMLMALPLPAEPECKCGAPGEPPHPCPYKEEINGDASPCNCCHECRSSCAEEI